MLFNASRAFRPRNHLAGKHRGICVDNNDPLGIGRIRAKIEHLIETNCPVDLLPWISPDIGDTGRGDGAAQNIPPVNSLVYISFPNNDVYFPIYTGSAAYQGKSSLALGYSNIRPYQGNVDPNSKELRHYDPNNGDDLGPHTPSIAIPNSAHFNSMSSPIMANLMKDFNLTKEQAAGILGNLGHESGGFTQLQEIGGGGYGWAQWTGPRRTAYMNWAAANNLDPASPEANYGFLSHELRTSESGALAALRKTTTVDEATRSFQDNFERPGVLATQSRLNYAHSAYDHYTGPDSPGTLQPGNDDTIDPTTTSSVASGQRQGPTLPKKDEEENFPSALDDGGAKEHSRTPGMVGVSWPSSNQDPSRKTPSNVNFIRYDTSTNTVDMFLDMLQTALHIDPQGRIWIDLPSDLMISIGGDFYAHFKKGVYAHVEGEIKTQYEKDVTQTYHGDTFVTSTKSLTSKFDGNILQQAGGAIEAQSSTHAIKASTSITRDSPHVSDTNSDGVPVSTGDDGQPKRDKKETDEHQKTTRVEHDKRKVYTSEISRGLRKVSDVATQAAGRTASTLAQRAAELNLDTTMSVFRPGGVDPVIGTLTSQFPELGRLTGGLSSILGGITQFNNLARGIGQIASNPGQLAASLGLPTLPAVSAITNQLPLQLNNILNNSPLSRFVSPSTLQGLAATLLQQSGNLLPVSARNALNTAMGSLNAADVSLEHLAEVSSTILSEAGNPTAIINSLLQVPLGANPQNSVLSVLQQNPLIRQFLSYRQNPLSSALSVLNNPMGITASGTLPLGATGVDADTNYLAFLAPEYSLAHAIRALDYVGGPQELSRSLNMLMPDLTKDQHDLALQDLTSSLKNMFGDDYANVATSGDILKPASVYITGIDSYVSDGQIEVAKKIAQGLDNKADTPTPVSSGIQPVALQTSEVSNLVPANSNTPTIPAIPASLTSSGLFNLASLTTNRAPSGNPAATCAKAPDLSAPTTLVSNQPDQQPLVPTSLYQNSNFLTDGSSIQNTPGVYTAADLADGKYTADELKITQYGSTAFVTKRSYDALSQAMTAFGTKQPILASYVPASAESDSGAHAQGDAYDISTDGLSDYQKQQLLLQTLDKGFNAYSFHDHWLHVEMRDAGGQITGPVPSWANQPIIDGGFQTGAPVLRGRLPGQAPYADQPQQQYPGSGVGSVPPDEPSLPVNNTGDWTKTEWIVAQTAYGEAVGEGNRGMHAVINVIMNRVKSGKFPSTPEGVCLQHTRNGIYQFSCWNVDAAEGNRATLQRLNTSNSKFLQALALARQGISGGLADITGGADHYLTRARRNAVQGRNPPHWSWTMPVTAVIGHHVFLKSG